MMLWMVILFPLLGAIINGFFLRKVSKKFAHIVGSAALIASFICALLTFIDFVGSGGEASIRFGFDWLEAGDFRAPFQIVLDRLSGFMMVMVTGVASLIHIYAGGYMHDEKETWRFFAYLNFFVFMMLLLVLGENLLVMFIGWEGVGLCSYLLIGYWYDDKANAAAGMKAFLTNRIGDIGFLVAIFLCYRHFGTVSFSELRGFVDGGAVLTAFQLSIVGYITLALFIGACGKSAQMPLYVWLPDAMAGPTPVSALIHAATMVTAGIYMMTRMSFFFYLAPNTQFIVAIVGATTALFAATIALVQTDIKKVLAYSTCSQLGYMVMACGVGAFSGGMFHVFTHACFKALLFMGAGSVIVAMHHKQEMSEMGGLRKYMPITHKVMLVGVLAIIGTPFLSGFFSKDEILWKAYIGGQHFGLGAGLWIVGVIAACCTSFYMVRLLMLTFYGENRSDAHTREHLHETSPVMWAPLVVLAVASIFVGYLNVPHLLSWIPVHHGIFDTWLEPITRVPESAAHHWAFLTASYPHSLEYGLMAVSITGVALSALTAVKWYANGPAPITKTLATRYKAIHSLWLNKYWVDELYEKILITPLKDMSYFLWKIVDVVIIDGIVNGVGQACVLIGGLLSFKSTGSVNRHAVVLVLGIVCMLTAIMIS
jgi:NADH-quinone oxidoreductase subunit L